MTNSNRLPADYSAPKQTSDYFKPQDGDSKIRILTSPILGFLDWNDKTPVRTKTKPETSFDATRPPRFFRAMCVWDYSESKVKVREITQRSIQIALEDLARDEDFGSPLNYDIKITKTGKDLETKYSIKPLAKSEVSANITTALFDAGVNLDKLFSGENPFTK